MHPAYATLVRYFDRCRLNYQLRADLQAAQALIAVKNAWYPVMVQVDTALSLCEVFVLAQPTIPAHRLAALAEAVCRINYTLAGGRFDLDFDARQFRFHNSHHFLGADLTETEIEHVLGQSL